MYIKNFINLSKRDVNIAGGKGASLGEMLKNKISVPPGFVILASAFDRFLEEVDLFQDIEAQLHRVNYEDINNELMKNNNIFIDYVAKNYKP